MVLVKRHLLRPSWILQALEKLQLPEHLLDPQSNVGPLFLPLPVQFSLLPETIFHASQLLLELRNPALVVLRKIDQGTNTRFQRGHLIQRHALAPHAPVRKLGEL